MLKVTNNASKLLQSMVEESKPERLIRQAWREAAIEGQRNAFIKKIEKEYKELYPELSEDKYVTYIDKKNIEVIDEETNETIIKTEYIYEDSCYEEVTKKINSIDVVVKELKDECKQLIEEGKIKPSLDLYLKEKFNEKEMEDSNPFKLTMNSYVSFIKPILLDKVNKKFEEAMRKITKSYPEHEQKTWPDQEHEAIKYKADDTTPTPILSQIAEIRGLTVDELADKVIEKTNAYKYIVALAIGYRQKAEDMLESVTTITQLDEIIAELKENAKTFNKILNQ